MDVRRRHWSKKKKSTDGAILHPTKIILINCLVMGLKDKKEKHSLSFAPSKGSALTLLSLG